MADIVFEDEGSSRSALVSLVVGSKPIDSAVLSQIGGETPAIPLKVPSQVLPCEPAEFIGGFASKAKAATGT